MFLYKKENNKSVFINNVFDRYYKILDYIKCDLITYMEQTYNELLKDHSNQFLSHVSDSISLSMVQVKTIYHAFIFYIYFLLKDIGAISNRTTIDSFNIDKIIKFFGGVNTNYYGVYDIKILNKFFTNYLYDYLKDFFSNIDRVGLFEYIRNNMEDDEQARRFAKVFILSNTYNSYYYSNVDFNDFITNSNNDSLNYSMRYYDINENNIDRFNLKISNDIIFDTFNYYHEVAKKSSFVRFIKEDKNRYIAIKNENYTCNTPKACVFTYYRNKKEYSIAQKKAFGFRVLNDLLFNGLRYSSSLPHFDYLPSYFDKTVINYIPDEEGQMSELFSGGVTSIINAIDHCYRAVNFVVRDLDVPYMKYNDFLKKNALLDIHINKNSYNISHLYTHVLEEKILQTIFIFSALEELISWNLKQQEVNNES